MRKILFSTQQQKRENHPFSFCQPWLSAAFACCWWCSAQLSSSCCPRRSSPPDNEQHPSDAKTFVTKRERLKNTAHLEGVCHDKQDVEIGPQSRPVKGRAAGVVQLGGAHSSRQKILAHARVSKVRHPVHGSVAFLVKSV